MSHYTWRELFFFLDSLRRSLSQGLIPDACRKQGFNALEDGLQMIFVNGDVDALGLVEGEGLCVDDVTGERGGDHRVEDKGEGVESGEEGGARERHRGEGERGPLDGEEGVGEQVGKVAGVVTNEDQEQEGEGHEGDDGGGSVHRGVSGPTTDTLGGGASRSSSSDDSDSNESEGESGGESRRSSRIIIKTIIVDSRHQKKPEWEVAIDDLFLFSLQYFTDVLPCMVFFFIFFTGQIVLGYSQP